MMSCCMGDCGEWTDVLGSVVLSLVVWGNCGEWTDALGSVVLCLVIWGTVVSGLMCWGW